MSRFKTYKVIYVPKKYITDLKLELNPPRHHKGKIDYNGTVQFPHLSLTVKLWFVVTYI